MKRGELTLQKVSEGFDLLSESMLNVCCQQKNENAVLTVQYVRYPQGQIL